MVTTKSHISFVRTFCSLLIERIHKSFTVSKLLSYSHDKNFRFWKAKKNNRFLNMRALTLILSGDATCVC